ncbi:MAG: NADH:flavin oxidoreductase [Thermodesulfobacteriota bacterium]
MSKLFEPIKIGNFEIKNRFVRSATYYAMSDENGFITGDYVQLMKTLAENGVGLIMTGFAYVLKNGQVGIDMNGIQDDDHIPQYLKVTKAVHDCDGRIVMQIVHGGAASLHAAKTGPEYLVVSQVNHMPNYGRTVKEMSQEDIGGVIDAFGQAARRVQEAGFDGVQIHGAHGYLLSQFFSPRTNIRTDRWGGSLENRMRFAVEVVRSVKKSVGPDFPIMIKLGVCDYLKPGDYLTWGRSVGRMKNLEPLDPKEDRPGLTIDEGTQIARTLEKEGVVFIEISNGFLGTSSYRLHVGINAPEKEAYFLNEARIVRGATQGPLCLVGGMRSLPVMEAVIRSGVADCISISRPLIREPGLIRRWRDGDTRPAECISCGGCFNEDKNGKMNIYCRQLKKQREKLPS